MRWLRPAAVVMVCLGFAEGAGASLIQTLFVGTENRGFIQFSTPDSTDPGASVIDADFLLGGLHWTENELRFGLSPNISLDWEIDGSGTLVGFSAEFIDPGDIGGSRFISIIFAAAPSIDSGFFFNTSTSGCSTDPACDSLRSALQPDRLTMLNQPNPAFVPEPRTALLFGTALAGLALRRRRP